jgi:autotransporter-associated beta strand protein
VSVVPTIPVTLWSNTSNTTAWHTSGNWSPSTSPSAWLTDDVAQFQNSGTSTTAGINMSNFSTSLSIGGIEMHGARTRALTIGNSSATTGVLTLNGSMINFIPNVILRNNSNSLLTIQNNETGTGKTMNVTLGNSTNNIIYIDSSGGISISSNISGSSRLLSLAGIGTGKLTLSGSNTFSGGVTINSGRSLNVNNNAALGTGTFTINGGIIDATVSGINITNAMQIGASFRYTGTQNLTQSTGNITLTTSPTITVDASVLSLGGVISGSFGITKAGSGTLTLTAGNLYSGITTVSAGTLRLNRTGGTTIPANNNVTVTGGTLQISTSQVLNDVNISGGTLQVDAGVTLTINGAYTGGGTIVNNGKIVITAASTFPGSSTTISAMNDLEINRSAGVALDKNMTVTGTLTLTSGILDLSSQTLTISGSVARTTGTIDADAGTLTFTNTTGSTLPSSLFSGNINNLTMNGSGGITLGNAVTVTGTLTLTSGLLTTTSTNLLTLADGSTVSGVSSSSFIHGPIKKVGNTGFTFPVGASGTGYQPIQIANFSGTTASTDAFTAEYKRSSASGVGTNINSPVNRVSFCEYWQLDRTTGTPTVDVTLHFNTNSGCGGGVPADYLAGNSGLLSELRVCRWDGTQWVNYSTSYTGTAPNVTLTATGISSFSPFTVGSTGLAPLPLKLLSFNGVKKDGKVYLNWTTLDETNMKSIVLQSSSDGEIVEKVTELLAQNTLHNHYTFTDTSDMMKRTYQSQNHRYYRLEFVNLDQSVEQSSWISVTDNELIKIKPQFRVYPNPTIGNSIYVDPIATGPALATIKLTDNTGKLILHEHANFRNPYKFPVDGLKTGLYYLMVILSDGSVENHKIIIQP